MRFAGNDDEFARDLFFKQSGVEEVGLALEGSGFAFAIDDQERGRTWCRKSYGRRFGLPVVGRVAATETVFVEEQVSTEFVGFFVTKVKAGPADGDDAFQNFGRQTVLPENIDVQRDAGGELGAGGMATDEKARAIGAISVCMRIDPGRGARDVVDLFAPGDLGLKAVVDDRDGDSV